MESHHHPLAAGAEPNLTDQEKPVQGTTMHQPPTAGDQGQADAAEPVVFLEREKLLSSLLAQIWNVMLLVSMLGGVASIQRFRYTGWMPIYSVHASIILAFFACWLMRNRLSFNLRVGIIMALFYVVGITGLFSFGLIGAGIWWLILCSLLASVFYSTQTGMIHGIICLGIILTAAVAVTTGLITVPFDANVYIRQPSIWLTLLIGCVALSMFIFSAFSTYQNAMVELLQEVENSKQQKIQLLAEQKKALDEIIALRSIIPICSSCRKVRDDDGFWETVDTYMHKRTDIQFSHSICPDCGERLYGGVWNEAMGDEKLHAHTHAHPESQESSEEKDD